jgi:hypothetical protein
VASYRIFSSPSKMAGLGWDNEIVVFVCWVNKTNTSPSLPMIYIASFLVGCCRYSFTVSTITHFLGVTHGHWKCYSHNLQGTLEYFGDIVPLPGSRTGTGSYGVRVNCDLRLNGQVLYHSQQVSIIL